jgi:hypothetical protein
VGRDSVVGIATRYGLDGPGIESRWGPDFHPPSRPAMGPTQPPVQRPERGVDHPPPSSAEVKERVQLYVYFHCVPSWPGLGWALQRQIISDCNNGDGPVCCAVVM